MFYPITFPAGCYTVFYRISLRIIDTINTIYFTPLFVTAVAAFFYNQFGECIKV